jgi:hypothetical protein
MVVDLITVNFVEHSMSCIDVDVPNVHESHVDGEDDVNIRLSDGSARNGILTTPNAAARIDNGEKNVKFATLQQYIGYCKYNGNAAF